MNHNGGHTCDFLENPNTFVNGVRPSPCFSTNKVVNKKTGIREKCGKQVTILSCEWNQKRHCYNHWKDICDYHDWDPELSRCANNMADAFNTSLEDRKNINQFNINNTLKLSGNPKYGHISNNRRNKSENTFNGFDSLYPSMMNTGPVGPTGSQGPTEPTGLTDRWINKRKKLTVDEGNGVKKFKSTPYISSFNRDIKEESEPDVKEVTVKAAGTLLSPRRKKRRVEHDYLMGEGKDKEVRIKPEEIPKVFTFPSNKRKSDSKDSDEFDTIEGDSDSVIIVPPKKMRLPMKGKRKMINGKVEPLNLRDLYVRRPIDDFLSQQSLDDIEIIWLQFSLQQPDVDEFKKKYNCRNTFGSWWRAEIPLADISKLKEDRRISRVEGGSKMWSH